MSYVRIWIHAVWGTKNHIPFLTKENKHLIIKHIRQNAQKKNIYLNTINGHREHLHALISLNPTQSISKVMQLLKGESSHWINELKITKAKFEWADEYFAVSVSESQVDKVRNYIKRQEMHHKVKTRQEEYSEFMKKYGFTKLED